MNGRPVRLVPWDPSWPAAFEAEREALAGVLGPAAVAIHHVGSTSVPGLVAKPVLDVLVEVDALEAVDAATHRMEALGYEARGEYGIPGRRYFSRRAGERGAAHVHAFLRGDPQVERHLAFRDRLRAHPEEAARYAALKRELAAAHAGDRDAYQAGKADFIAGVEARAAHEGRGAPVPGARPAARGGHAGPAGADYLGGHPSPPPRPRSSHPTSTRMIDPAYWRPGLAKDLRRLRKARTFRRWSERKVALFERRIVLVAAQIHVLLARAELPAVLVSQPLGCLRYPRRPGEAVGRLSQGDVPAVFRMEAPQPDALTAAALCHHVVHPALVGAVSNKPRRFTHLWVVTGDDEPVLYELEIEGLLEFFARFAEGPRPRRAARRGRRRLRGKRGEAEA